jgi:hypothetical protein
MPAADGEMLWNSAVRSQLHELHKTATAIQQVYPAMKRHNKATNEEATDD